MHELRLLADDPARLSGSAAAALVATACARDTEDLARAVRYGWLDKAVLIRDGAVDVQRLVQQRSVGIDTVLTVAEVLRRAERAVGLLVKREQDAGRLARRGDAPPQPTKEYQRWRLGRLVTVQPSAVDRPVKPSASQFFRSSDDWSRSFAVVGVTDEQWEQVLAAARAARNMSRNAVMREVRKLTQPPLPPRTPSTEPGAQLGDANGRARREDLTRPAEQRTVISNAAASLDSISAVLQRIEALHPDLDAEEAGQWLADFHRARRAIGGFINTLKERTRAYASSAE